MASRIRPVFAYAGTVLLLGAFLLLMGMGGAPKEPQISIEGARANMSGMFLGAGSVFFTINNTGGQDELLSAVVDIPGAVAELHGVKGMRMFKLEKIDVPADRSVVLKPGSDHIMIFNMPRKVREGSKATLKLRFRHSGERIVPIRFESAEQEGH